MSLGNIPKWQSMIFNPPTYTTSDDCYSIAYNFVGSFRTPIPTLTLMDVPLPKYPDPKSARSPCLYCTDSKGHRTEFKSSFIRFCVEQDWVIKKIEILRQITSILKIAVIIYNRDGFESFWLGSYRFLDV